MYTMIMKMITKQNVTFCTETKQNHKYSRTSLYRIY